MSEPKGTLDTSVNGPEDPPGVFDGDAWQQVDWRMHEERVRRLRRRIFKAVRDGDLAKARNLQKLMLRNWSDTLVSVRQVTQRNAGRAAAGIDGRVALTARARAEVAVQVHATRSSWRPVAVKRVYIVRRGGALSYPQRSWEELGGSFLGLMANPKSKGGRDSSMPGKSRPWEGIEGVRDGTRVIWQRLDCLKSNLRSVKTRTRRNDAWNRCRTMRRHGM